METRGREPGKSEVITLSSYKKKLVGNKTKMNKSTKPVKVTSEKETTTTCDISKATSQRGRF